MWQIIRATTTWLVTADPVTGSTSMSIVKTRRLNSRPVSALTASKIYAASGLNEPFTRRRRATGTQVVRDNNWRTSGWTQEPLHGL
jgi:hypothetical protein